MIANDAAVALHQWLAFLNADCSRPREALQVMRELAGLHHSALADVRRTVKRLDQRSAVPPAESQEEERWELTEADLRDAYTWS